MANSVLTMFRDRQQAITDKAGDLNMRQHDIQEISIVWNTIKSLEADEGWIELVSLMKMRIESLRAQIVDGKIEDAMFARGELKAFEWLVQSTSLAEMHLIAVKQAQEALDADKEDFVHGAQE